MFFVHCLSSSYTFHIFMFYKTTESNLTKLCRMHYLGVQRCSNKGNVLFRVEIIEKYWKFNLLVYFQKKKFSQKPFSQKCWFLFWSILRWEFNFVQIMIPGDWLGTQFFFWGGEGANLHRIIYKNYLNIFFSATKCHQRCNPFRNILR